MLSLIERRSRPVALFEMSVAADTRVPPHDHERDHLCIVLAGGFAEEHRRGAEWCGPMSWRLSPAGDTHRLRIGSTGLTCLLVEPGAVELPKVRDRAYLAGTLVVPLARSLQRELAQGPHASTLTLESLTLELFTQATRTGGRRGEARPPWLALVRDALHASLPETPSLKALSQLADRHPMQVARGFRTHFGCSVGEYRQRVQLEYARRQLIESDAPLAAIAYTSGFADQSHMTRLLRQRLGVTPARLRAQTRAVTESDAPGQPPGSAK